jgi:hypothetical protein
LKHFFFISHSLPHTVFHLKYFHGGVRIHYLIANSVHILNSEFVFLEYFHGGCDRCNVGAEIKKIVVRNLSNKQGILRNSHDAQILIGWANFFSIYDQHINSLVQAV